MNKELQAKNGFKTFIVTLSVSLVIFSAIYYLITDSTGNVDIESSDPVAFEVKGASTESVFKDISTKPTHADPAVLQAADTTEDTTGDAMEEDAMVDDTTTGTDATDNTAMEEEVEEATVPDTGSETLVGTMMALGFFAAAVYMILAGPRKLAIAEFENKISKEL